MAMIRTFVLGAAALVALAVLTSPAQAGPPISIGVGIGGGYPYCGPGPYGRPYYGGYGYRPYPYYQPYAPVYYAPPPVVYVDQPVYVQPAPYVPTTWQITQVQTQLGRLRYYQGTPDGVIGPMTRNAVANFQQDRGLIVTGNINSQVLNALEIPL